MAPQELSHEIVDFDFKRANTDIEYARSIIKSPSFLSYSPAFKSVLGPSPKLTLVEQRADKFAHEAGLYIKPTNSVYFTSNFQTSDPVELYSIHATTWKISKQTYAHVVNGNGGCAYKDKILYCSQGDRVTASALVLVDPTTSASEILLNNFHGREFNSINDVVIHHARDEIWFTDPTYGYEQNFRPAPQLPCQIYRFNSKIGEVVCVADGFEMCNGLCFSPDYKRLYVTDTGACQAHGGPGDGRNMSFDKRLPSSIYVFDVEEGKRLVNRRFFAYCDQGVPDGIKCDEHGNVYSGCGDGVHVWDSEGRMIGKILVGGAVANFNFVSGGMWLFGEKCLYFCKMEAKGALVSIECEG